jgi:TolB protein
LAWLRLLTGALLVGSLILAAPVAANHVGCGDVITQDTTLDSDLRCADTAIVIGADGITLDLGGHTITGPGKDVRTDYFLEPAGVRNGTLGRFDFDHFVDGEPSHDGVTIRDGTIRGFRTSVMASEAPHQTITDVVADSFLRTGNQARIERVRAQEARVRDDGRVVDSRFIGGGIRAGQDAVIERNVVTRAPFEGIAAVSGSIARNVVRNGGAGPDGGTGIAVNAGSDKPMTVVDNVVSANRVGIQVGASTPGSAIVGNRAYGNREVGLSIVGAGHTPLPIAGNIALDNGGHGVSASGCVDVHDNIAQRNGGTGIRLFSDSLAFPGLCVSAISRNNSSSNGRDGISVENNGSPVRVTDNVVHKNGADGIRIGPARGTEESPTWSPDGRQVAFVSDRDGQKDIYVANADGSRVRRLTNTRVGERALAWSPDGRSIGFLPDQVPRPFVVDVAGGPPRLVVNFRTSALDWSPDGTRLVLADEDLYTVNVDGSGLTQITFTTFGAETDPRWSPDGRRISYRWEEDIYVVNADGTDPHLVMESHTNFGEGPRLFWSPDSARVYENLRSVRWDGTDLRDVDVADPEGSGLYAGADAFNPDGTRLVFNLGIDMWTVGVDGASPERVTDDSGVDADLLPAWSPDGASILYRINEESREDGTFIRSIGVVAPDGSNPRRIVNDSNPLVTLTANQAEKNKGLGIRAVRNVVDGGGNRAAKNHDKRQCVNVVCSS